MMDAWHHYYAIICDQHTLFFSNFFHWADLPWDAFLHISVKNKFFLGRAIIVADINIISMESVPKARLCCLQSQIK